MSVKEQSRHAYQKRIKHLESEVERLSPYRTVVMNIFDGIMGINDTTVNKNWLVKQMRSCFQ